MASFLHAYDFYSTYHYVFYDEHWIFHNKKATAKGFRSFGYRLYWDISSIFCYLTTYYFRGMGRSLTFLLSRLYMARAASVNCFFTARSWALSWLSGVDAGYTIN